MRRSRTGLLAALAVTALLALSACASSPAASSSSGSSTEASSDDTAAVSTVTVSCEEFNSVATVEDAYAAMGRATGSTYTEANDHRLLQGAQNACSMDLSRTLNEVMTELTDGQVTAASTPSASASTGASSGSTDPIAEACTFSSNEPYYTVEILADFPAVWKSDAPLPATGGNPVCHQSSPGSGQIDRYWVYFNDESAGNASAQAWDAALVAAGYTRTCAEGSIATAMQDSRAKCEYVNSNNQSAAIDFNHFAAINRDHLHGWQLWFLPHN